MQNHLRLKDQNGQTLGEALITLVFIALSIIALIRFQNYLGYSNNLTQQKSVATRLALKQIETLRDFQVLNNTSGYTSYQSIATGSSSYTGASATYTIAWTVTSFSNPTYKTIDVTVSWTDRTNQAQSVRLISYVAGVEPAYSAAIM